MFCNIMKLFLPSVSIRWSLHLTLLVLLCLSLPIGFAQTDPVRQFEPDARELLQQKVTELTIKHQELTERLQEVRSQQQRLSTSEETLNEYLAALQGSFLIYRVLQEQRLGLPQPIRDPELSDFIAGLRLQQFEVAQQRRTNRESRTRDPAELLQLQEIIDRILSTSVVLQQEQRDLISSSERIRMRLDESLFWIPSNRPLNLNWFLLLPKNAAIQIKELVTQISVRPDLKHPLEQVAGATMLLLLAFFCWFGRERLRYRISEINQLFRNYTQQRYYSFIAIAEAVPLPPPNPWLTPQALLAVAARVLPGPLLLSAAGVLMFQSADSGVPGLGQGLIAIALSWFVVRFMGQIVGDSRIAEHHFGWSDQQRRELLWFLKKLIWVLLPTSFVLALAEQQTLALNRDVIGMLVLIVSFTTISWLFFRLLRRLPLIYNSQGIHWLVMIVLVLLPLALVVMTMMGYYYTSLKLTGRVLATFYLLTGWVIAEAVIMRGIELGTERLRHQRMMKERELAQKQAAASDGESNSDPDLEALPQLDIDQIRNQTLRLGRFALLLAFGVATYAVWYDLLSTFHYLDHLVLWEYGSGDSPLPISLSDFLTFLFIIGFTIFLAGNLPGLLEMLVLSRLNLQQGSAYAITTLMNYTITAIGLVFALSSLGVSWDKLQWLVAALSVGLGFGLQEIFANFVSGLIILFERPIRIGDVVTLDNVSGRVRQIRIRATTITDFDRKDIIVPNKTFVTGQLINWSLTDTVTRVVVKVGVAYGSDLERTREILLEAARINDRVLSDPEPQVLFLSFGDSTLDHELRIHVKELYDRNPAIDEINRHIDREFKKSGIEISFKQLDIHLRNSEGLEKLVTQQARPLAPDAGVKQAPVKGSGDVE